MYCQSCKTPLRPDTSLEDISPAALKLLTEASNRSLKNDALTITGSRMLYTPDQKKLYDEASSSSNAEPLVTKSALSSSTPSSRRASASDHPSMSFVMLTESQMGPLPVVEPQSKDKSGKSDSRGRRSSGKGSVSDNDGLLSHQMEKSARLFDVISSRSDIDHPICVECSDLIVEGMERRLAAAIKERDAYAEYLKNANADQPTEEEVRQAGAEEKALLEEEAAAFAELEELEREKAQLEEEIAAAELEERALDKEEEDFWRERNAATKALADIREERDSLEMQYAHDLKQLEKLQKANVWNDLFDIRYDSDGFGTINGLRLGRKSGKNVEWAEVNAAWGQAMLLIKSVAAKLEYQFVGYDLKPLGSTSTIDKLETTAGQAGSSKNAKSSVTATLELFYSSDLPLSIGFLHRHFDAAMIAFLECVRQLGAHIERTFSASVKAAPWPYTIRKDKIDDVSIKLGSFNGDESWTKACKLVLICCKFCLAHASKVDEKLFPRSIPFSPDSP